MNRRIILLIGLVLQLLFLFGLFLPSQWTLASGTPVTLETVPVDPRSILRGDYVILSYEATQGLPTTFNWGDPVYIVLEKKGDVYERVAYLPEKPQLQPGQVCLRASAQYGTAVIPDLAQYFVPEGKGLEFEQAQREHRLLVDAMVTKNCKAAIKAIRLGEEAPVTDTQNGMMDLQDQPAMLP